MQIVIAVLLLAGNAFFVAVEFAVTRARPTMVSDLVSRGARGARSLQHAVQHIDANPAPGRSVEHRPDGTVRVAGEARLEAVGRELGLDVEEHREATFGGYLVGLSGRVPGRGEVLDLGHWQATVDERDDGTIGSVTLRRSEHRGANPDRGAAER